MDKPLQRYAILGAECSGKTSFSEALAAEWGMPWVPEFARLWVNHHKRDVQYADVEEIAEGEKALMERATRDAASVNARGIVFDTSLLQTLVYSQFYFGKVPEVLVRWAAEERLDTYFLMDPLIPWVSEENQRSDDKVRLKIHGLLLAELADRKITAHLLRGDLKSRLDLAKPWKV